MHSHCASRGVAASCSVHVLKSFGGDVFEVMRAAPELALVMAPVVQVEDVIASLVEQRRDVADPVVVSVRQPVLNAARDVRRFVLSLLRLEGGKIDGRLPYVLPVQPPGVLLGPPRIAEGKVVVE